MHRELRIREDRQYWSRIRCANIFSDGLMITAAEWDVSIRIHTKIARAFGTNALMQNRVQTALAFENNGIFTSAPTYSPYKPLATYSRKELFIGMTKVKLSGILDLLGTPMFHTWPSGAEKSIADISLLSYYNSQESVYLPLGELFPYTQGILSNAFTYEFLQLSLRLFKDTPSGIVFYHTKIRNLIERMIVDYGMLLNPFDNQGIFHPDSQGMLIIGVHDKGGDPGKSEDLEYLQKKARKVSMVFKANLPMFNSMQTNPALEYFENYLYTTYGIPLHSMPCLLTPHTLNLLLLMNHPALRGQNLKSIVIKMAEWLLSYEANEYFLDLSSPVELPSGYIFIPGNPVNIKKIVSGMGVIVDLRTKILGSLVDGLVRNRAYGYPILNENNQIQFYPEIEPWYANISFNTSNPMAEDIIAQLYLILPQLITFYTQFNLEYAVHLANAINLGDIAHLFAYDPSFKI